MSTPPPGKKLRTACDICHQGKMKCSGGTPCSGCQESGYHCYYSLSQRLGRPKGTKNKRSHNAMDNQHVNIGPTVPTAETNPQQVQSLDPISSSHGFDDIFSGTETHDMSYSLLNSDSFWDSLGLNAGGDYEIDNIMSAEKVSNTAPQRCILEATARFMDIDRTFNISPAHILNNTGVTTSETNSSNGRRANENGIQQPLSEPLSFSSTRPSTSCDCFETHVNLLSYLKELDRDSSTPLTFDAVLTGARQAFAPWERLIQCSACQNDEDQSALLLSAMSIRAILRRLQRLFTENRYSSEEMDHEKILTAVGPMMIGNYTPTAEEQILVMDVLILNTLGKIKRALISLRERHERTRQNINGEPGQPNQSTAILGGLAKPDQGCMHAMLCSLDSTVQVIEKAVKSIIASHR